MFRSFLLQNASTFATRFVFSTSLGATSMVQTLRNYVQTNIVIRSISSGRSRRGLYDGKDVRTGNQVSFSARKTKRKFKPNVILKRVYSETLDQMLRFHMTTATLRSIDKAGGLDNYLLTTKHNGEGEGLVAKRRIMKKMRKRERRRLLSDEGADDPNPTIEM